MADSRPPFPPYTRETAIRKVRAAEDAWNTCDPARVALAYTVDSRWRNRDEFVHGRTEITGLLTRKWARELEYRLIKELWAFAEDRIAVRFAYECRDADSAWWRAYGNENWHFDANGLMRARHASINDLRIVEADRLFHWDRSGPRPADAGRGERRHLDRILRCGEPLQRALAQRVDRDDRHAAAGRVSQ